MVSCNLMRGEDEDSLAAHCEVCHGAGIDNRISFGKGGAAEGCGVDVPYDFFQTSNSFHGVNDSWEKFPRNGIPFGPGGSFPVR